MSTTPNMSLLLPVVSVTPGPTYASENNDAFDVIDSHDHTVGKGLPVPSNGININNDLSFNGFNASVLRSTQFQSQSSPLSLPSDLSMLYVVNGNLFYNNQIGQQVQITSGAALDATSIGGIGGDYVTSTALEFYTSLTRTFTFWSNNNVPANIDAGSVTIREVALSPNGITLMSPASLAASYSITLPGALPSTTSFLSMDNTGQILYGGLITTAQITPGAITQALLAPKPFTNTTAGVGEIAFNNFSFSTSSTSGVDVTGSTITLTTTGRPVVILLQTEYGLAGATTGYVLTSNSSNRDVSGSLFIINVTQGGTGVQQTQVGGTAAAIAANNQFFTPPSVVTAVDMGVVGLPGTYTYKLQASVGVASTALNLSNCAILAYEM